MRADNDTQCTPSNARIVVVGASGVSLTVQVERAPEAGETIIGTRVDQGPGGKGSNQAVGARRLGADVQLVSIVGDDAHGALLRRLWADEGVGTDGVVTCTEATMVGVILVDAAGENRIAIVPGAVDRLNPAGLESSAQVLETSDLVLVSLEIPLATATAALGIAASAGVPTILDPAPAAALDADAWASIDHLTPNRIEAAMLAGIPAASDADAAVTALRRVYDGAIVLTCGSDGVLVDANGNREHIGAVPVETVVDTTGAGDAFTAAYAVAITHGAEPIEAARHAARAGAFAVTRNEVIPALPRPSDLGARS